MLCLREGRVVLAGMLSEIAPPDDAQILDLAGRTVLAGVVNAHLHGAHSPEFRREVYLRAGVTTLGDLAAPLQDVPLLRRQRTATGLATPRTLTAGPALTAPAGYPLQRYGRDWGLEVATASDAARAVRLLQQWGVRMVKLVFEPGTRQAPLPVLGREAACAAVQQARELDMPVRAHIAEARGLLRALQVGVDMVEHLPLRTSRGQPSCKSDGGRLRIAGEVEELLAQLAANGVLLTPTLDALARSVWDNAPLFALVRRFHELGGRLALGTDAPFAGVAHGLPLRELQLLQEAGVPAAACLQACGRHGGLACGLDDVGLLRPGFTADALVCAGDPLQDFQALQALEMVIFQGEIVFSQHDGQE